MTGAYQFLKKYGLALSAGIGGLIAFLSYAFILGGYPEFNPSNEELYKLGIFDFALYSTYFLVIGATALVAIFSILNVVKNPKESRNGLIGVGIFVVLFILSYTMGDGTLTEGFVTSDPSLLPAGVKFEAGITQSSNLQIADGLIKFTYILMFLSGVAMLLGAARDLMNQR